MSIAFHAPMKPPDHPVPSGDRQMARHLLQALAVAGFDPRLASRFTSFDATGDAARQQRLAAAGQAEAARLIAHYRAARPTMRPRLWFTYHLYHKAPDHLGPAVTRALAIPYVVAEASVAAKQADGAWAVGYAAAARAIGAADLVLVLNPADEAGVRPLLADRRRLVGLPPCIDTRPFAAAAVDRARHRQALASRCRLDPGQPWLVTVAMMRPGAKLASYRLLAAALSRLAAADPRAAWTLLIAGDGPARSAVEAACAGFGDRVRRLGELPRDALPALLAAADLFVWPAIGEAFGVALIEAAAAGLPVVAGASPGVAGLVADGLTGLLPPPGDVDAFAAAVARLLADPDLRCRLGRAAARRTARQHGLALAAARLRRRLRPLLAEAIPLAAAG